MSGLGQKQTCAVQEAMSAKGQNRTHAVQQTESLFGGQAFRRRLRSSSQV